MKDMRKTTVTMIVGIVIGMSISNISDKFGNPVTLESDKNIVPPVATKIQYEQVMAPGLQIVEVPHPLNVNGAYPYQCYFNGEIVQLPKDLVKEFLAENGVENSPSVNVQNFLGNLEYISVPVGTSLPKQPSVSQGGRTR